MRIALTIESTHGPDDVLVDCDDAATVGDLEHALRARFGCAVPVPGSAHDRLAGTLVNGTRLGGRGPNRVPPSGPPGVLRVHVISGPDAGVILALPNGEHVLGRSGGLSWADPGISRRHLRVRVRDREVEVCDLESRHGTVLGGQAVPPGVWTAWRPGELLEMGNSVVVLAAGSVTALQSEPTGTGWRRVLRPPRLVLRQDEALVNFPDVPRPPERRQVPVVAMLVPLVVGAAIAGLMRRPEYLLFTLIGPVMLAANFASGRWSGSRSYAAAMANYAHAYAEAEQALEEAIGSEERWLRRCQPDAAEALMTAVIPGRRLWERRRDELDFLRVRLGIADQPSSVIVNGSSIRPAACLVPYSVDLAAVGTFGIAGPVHLTDGLLRWLIAQLVIYRAPRDLSIIFLSCDADESWGWLRWLPHLAPRNGSACAVTVGNDRESVAARVVDVGALIRSRAESVPGRRSLSSLSAVAVVVKNYREVAAAADLTVLMRDGPAVGVFVLCAAGTDLELPEHTGALMQMSDTRGTVIAADGVRHEHLLVEQVSHRWVERCARGLASFCDVATEDAQVPEKVRLSDLLKLERPEDIRTRWLESGPRAVAVLGGGADGKIAIDLGDDGPHALIAGTTGSGKSELLQSLVVSMAASCSPDWLNFLLIDYKGDSAFSGCADLPHVVGKVNDLNPALVERALISLRAELDLRKKLLARANAKDIEGYQTLARENPETPPLPRLVIVIDEFAELARELPDFVDGLVSVAQLGRSLGVHLVLATQRPSGVVSAAIRANTNIRIALRVMDDVDSSDVLGVTDAARIPSGLAGRALLRLGGGSVMPFQAAQVNGHQSTSGRSVRVTSLGWDALGYAIPDSDGACDPKDRSDLATLVAHVGEAAAGVARPRRPWLDPLPSRLLWSAEGITAKNGLILPFGLEDRPFQQRQEAAVLDLARHGHLFFVGAPGSGRSQALRAIAGSIAELAEVGDVHLYGLDCGAGALGPLARLPHCGAVIGRHEAERAGRLLDRITGELEVRQARLGREGVVDISEQRQHAADPIPHIVMMLDGWEGFMVTLGQIPEHLESVMTLLREGASVGIHLLITGDRSLITNTRLSSAAERKYFFRLAERSDYTLAGLGGQKVPTVLPPGRCYGPGGVETQIYLLDCDASGRAQAEVLRHLGEIAGRRCNPRSSAQPFRIDALPSRLDLADALALVPPGGSAPFPIVGVGGDELVALGPDLTASSAFAVVGPSRSGRSSALHGAALSALATGARVILVLPRGGPLSRCIEATAVFGPEALPEDLEAAVAQKPALLIVDDADHLPAALDPYLMAVARGALPGVFLLVAGTADSLSGGFSNWQAHVRRARQGLLLSPRGVSDGDIVGVRLPRSSVGGPVRPGLGLLHLGDGGLIPVATVLGHAESPQISEEA